MSVAKKPRTQLVLAVAGVFAAAFGLRQFNRYLLMLFSLPARVVLTIVTQWLIFLIPGTLMAVGGERIAALGFRKERILRQILTGVLIALVMSAVLTVLPILLGYKDMVGEKSYQQLWKFVYEFFYAILGVALAEELAVRGYIFHKLLEIRPSRRFAVIISSILFGLFHIFGGNLIQVAMTAVIGLIYCICREKIRDCTLLSLIVAHGLYDAMIVVWVSVL